MKKFIIFFAALILMAMPVYAEDIITSEVVTGPSMQELHDHFYKSDIPAVFSNIRAAAPTSNLFYDQLTDTEKPIYDAFEVQINNTLDGKSPVTCDLKLTVEKNLQVTKENFFPIIVPAIEKAYNMNMNTILFRGEYAFVNLDHPEYFWIDSQKFGVSYSANYYSSSGEVNLHMEYGKLAESTGTTYFLDIYNDNPKAVKKDYDDMMAKAKEIVSSVPKGSSDWGKINHYMNWFGNNCTYNEYLGNGETAYAYIAPSALLHGEDGKNAPVCEGYSEAFKVLCDMSGIKAMCAESAGHKWNFVCLDGKYYHCDPTWFDNCKDSDPNGISPYQFMLIGSVNMQNRDQHDNHVISFQKPFQPPAISATDYLNDNGINDYNILNINNDNIINKNDSIDLLKIISGMSNGTAKDVNGDGKTDLNDVVKMQKLMFG